MGKPNFFEEWFVWPIKNWYRDLKLAAFNDVLKDNGMDWGAYPLEEVVQMYFRHKNEINRH